MKSDRELLELAAKAAGISVTTWDGHSGTQCAIDDVRHGRMWMPLTDDGDALRLAVKLGLTVYQWAEECCACNEKGTVNEGVSFVGSNPIAATRRAIVLAAAEIGGTV